MKAFYLDLTVMNFIFSILFRFGWKFWEKVKKYFGLVKQHIKSDAELLASLSNILIVVKAKNLLPAIITYSRKHG